MSQVLHLTDIIVLLQMNQRLIVDLFTIRSGCSEETATVDSLFPDFNIWCGEIIILHKLDIEAD